MNYDRWQEELAPYLREWGDDIEVRWAKLLTDLRAGDSVTGAVIAKAHFGAWVDIGVRFPALIEIPYVRDLTPERYRADDWCPIGSTIKARILGFATSMYQIRLAQVRQTWSVIAPEERRRLESLVADVRSLSDAIEKLGPPTHDIPGGRLSFDPATKASRSHRVLIYEGPSRNACVHLIERNAQDPELEILRRQTGVEDLD